MRKLILLLVLTLVPATALAAADEKKKEEEKPLTPAERVAIIKAVRPSLVRVEYTLKVDNGEAPGYYASFQPMSARRYRSYSGYGSELIDEERPLETSGLLLSPTTVLTHEQQVIHPRFIRKIAVRFGDELVPAQIAAYGQEQAVLFLKLEKPLKGARALEFKPDAEPPFQGVRYYRQGIQWRVSIGEVPKDLGISVTLADPERPFQALPPGVLIVDKKGTPVGMTTLDEIPADDSWKGPPLQWPTLTEGQMEEALSGIEKTVKVGMPRVTLYYRSARKTAGGTGYSRYYSRGDDGGDVSEQQTVGIVTDAKTILILADLTHGRTARLEKIKVHVPDGDPVNATFACTLADYGAFVATLEKPLPEAVVTLAAGDIREYKRILLLTAEVRIYGEKRVMYFLRDRIRSFHFGWQRRIYPSVSARNLFIFDQSGKLVLIPLRMRSKPLLEGEWERGGEAVQPAAHLQAVLSDLDKHSDPNNIPLSEEAEDRIAWLGVVMQGINSGLARANNVSEITRDGSIGALVSYVYPDSPAAKAGIEAGCILIRLHVEGYPRPLEMAGLGRQGGHGERRFPWDRMDDMPAEYLEELPKPWPAVSNALTKTLTAIGLGKKFTAEFVRGAKVIRKEFTIVQCPPRYDSAPRYKSKTLGLTVRDLTFEVRRYFQKKPQESGVIVSKVESGSKAYVAGLRPYEIISRVNENPTGDVKEFEKVIEGQTELRLAVKRMTRGRVVKIKLDKPLKDDKAKKPGDKKGK